MKTLAVELAQIANSGRAGLVVGRVARASPSSRRSLLMLAEDLARRPGDYLVEQAQSLATDRSSANTLVSLDDDRVYDVMGGRGRARGGHYCVFRAQETAASSPAASRS